MANQNYQEFARACQKEIGDEKKIKALFIKVGALVAKQSKKQLRSEQEAMQLGAQALKDMWEKGGKNSKVLAQVNQQLSLQENSQYNDALAQMARQGARLNYLSQLNGKCPEGYEVEKFMHGGCAKCRKKAEALMNIKPRFEKCGGKAKKHDNGGKAFQHVVGGPASTNSTEDMKLNNKLKKMLPKHKGGTTHNGITYNVDTRNDGSVTYSYSPAQGVVAAYGPNGYYFTRTGNPEDAIYGEDAKKYYDMFMSKYKAPFTYGRIPNAPVLRIPMLTYVPPTIKQ